MVGCGATRRDAMRCDGHDALWSRTGSARRQDGSTWDRQTDRQTDRREETSPEIRGGISTVGARDGCQLTTRKAVTSSYPHDAAHPAGGTYGEPTQLGLFLWQSSSHSGPGFPPKSRPSWRLHQRPVDTWMGGWVGGSTGWERDFGGRRLHSRTAFKAVTGFWNVREDPGTGRQGKGGHSLGEQIFSNTT